MKKANLLDLTTVRLHECEEDETGKVVILVRKFKNAWFSHFALGRRSPVIRIRLDEIGSKVWKAMDGKCSVTALLDHLNKHWNEAPEKISELDKRLAAFISIMYDNRYISFRELERLK